MSNGDENEKHIFEICEALKVTREQYKIKSYEEVFNNSTTIERLKTIANFIKDIKTEDF